MRIVIDMQGVQTESRFRGIGRYSLSLAKAMVRNRGEHEIVLVLSGLFPDTIEPIRAEFDTLLPQENICVWYTPGPVSESEPNNNRRREIAEFIREAFIASLKPDILHIMSLFEGYVDDAISSIGLFDKTTSISVLLHDLIPLLNSEHFLKPNPEYESYYLKKVEYLQKSSLLLSNSESTKQEGLNHLELYSGKIENLSAAVDNIFQSFNYNQIEKKLIYNKFSILHSFILYTGGADEHKNLPRLIRAYAKLSTDLREEHQLVFAGRIPETNIDQLQQEAKLSGLGINDLIFTGYITDDELVTLYNLCKLYVFPSWHEGFGLPALEAMSCGAAVIGSNTTSLPEVIGNKKALFDPLSEKEITDKISKVLTDEVFRQDLIEFGLTQAKQFSWDKSAKLAIAAFEKKIEKEETRNHRTMASHVLVNQIANLIPSDCSQQNLINLANAIARNHPQSGLRQLFVDVSELSQRDSATGVQRVTRSILLGLLNNPPVGYKVEPVYATPQSDGYSYAKKYTAQILEQSNISFTDEAIVPMAGDIFLGLDLQHHVITSQANYFEQLKQQNISLYFVVYDLLPITFSKYFAESHSELHKQWLEVISRFDGLVCISETIALETTNWISENFPERKERLNINYFHMGADIENSIPSEGLPANYKQTQTIIKDSHSFLMVGTLEPRKGQNQTLLAFEELWARGVDVNLVLVGKPGWMIDELIEKIQNHPQSGKKLFWLNGISDEYLDKIYKASTCLIAASEGEGFGLPLIEAAQHELPMMVRDIPVFREVASQYAYYFKGDTTKSLANDIEQWIKLFQEKKHPSSNKMPWVSWKQSTDRLLDVILPKDKTLPARQLLLDISELVQKDARSGIQRVVKSLLKELLNNAHGLQVEPVYATIDQQGYRYARGFTSKFLNSNTVMLNDDPIEYRAGDIFLGLDFQPQIVPAQQAFYQQLRLDGVQVQFVVYDLLCLLMPQYFVEGSSEGYEQWLEIVAENDGAICISKSVANDLDAWIKENAPKKLRPFKTSSFQLGADIENSIPSSGLTDNDKSIIEILRGQKNFLMVGTIEPRKAHAQTLAAFDQLWSEKIDVNLVIVGKQGWMVENLIEKINHHNELNKRLFWLEGISDEYLEKIYNISTCLIFASEGEGFGLPLIEAAQYKVPIISRDIPVLYEVAGEYAFYFNGNEPSDLSTSINKWLELYESKKHQKSDLMPWITWEQSTNLLLEKLRN